MATDLDLAQALSGHNTNFQILFQDQLARADAGEFMLYTKELTGDKAQTFTYAFIANLPRMRKWTGSRQPCHLKRIWGWTIVSWTVLQNQAVTKRTIWTRTRTLTGMSLTS